MSFDFKEDFFKRLKEIDKVPFLKQMSSEAGTIAVNFTKERFRDKNWVGKSRNPWKARANKDKGSLMNRSGRLKRSIKKLSSGRFYVYVGTDVSYAQIHNEGGSINKRVSVRSHTRTNKRTRKNSRVNSHTRKMNLKIPKRQFIGDSDVLARRVERHMYKKIKKALQ